MKTGLVTLLLVLFVAGCGKKEKPNPANSSDSRPPAVQDLSELQGPFESELVYAAEILQIGGQIGLLLETVKTPQDVQQAISKLRPLSQEYKQLYQKMENQYIGSQSRTYRELDLKTRNAVAQDFLRIYKQRDIVMLRLVRKRLPEDSSKMIEKEIPSFPPPVALINTPEFRNYFQSLGPMAETILNEKTQ